LRTTPDCRIVAGGEDSELQSPSRRAAAIPGKSKALLCALHNLFPEKSFSLAFAWSGAFAESPTGLPLIYEVPELPNCMAVLGCGGNGITFSQIASDIAASWAVGKRDPDAGLFEPKQD
jgi:glycine/D-amino acid oxidase-like deaminating enzyme